MMTAVVTLQGLVLQRKLGKLTFEEFLDAVVQCGDDTDNTAIKEAVEFFDRMADDDMEEAQAEFELRIGLI